MNPKEMTFLAFRREWARAHAPWLLVALAGFLLYARSFGYPFLNFDDWWLVHSSKLGGWLSPTGLVTTFFDLSKAARMEHGAEYLPVRDLWAAVQEVLFGAHPALSRGCAIRWCWSGSRSGASSFR